MTMIRLAAALTAIALLPAAVYGQVTPCVDGQADVFGCHNVTLLAHLDLEVFDSQAGNDSWGWTDNKTGREYALMALDDGVGFVDITDPAQPEYLGKLPTHTVPSVWRDVKVYADHAFVVSEADGHGMQVFDMGRFRIMDRSAAPVTFEADAHYGKVGHSHNVVINEATATAFIVGNREAAGCRGGLHMVDISDPLNPTFAGCFADDGYTHDAQCVIYEGPDTRYTGQEICFAANEDTVTLADVTDRNAPRMLSQAIYPNVAYTHQGWLTEDQSYFIANDELDEMRYDFNTRTLIFDVRDLENPSFVGPHFHDSPAIDHNLYVRGDVVYFANYRSGLRVARIDDLSAAALTDVAFFDTFPPNEGAQFGGAWSNYPFFESGTVVVSDMNRGLFVLRPYRDEPLALDQVQSFPTGEGVVLQWQVAGDAPARFVVEQELTDGHVDIGVIRGSSDRTTYRLFVPVAVGEHVLRLRGIDSGGMSVYSAPVTITVGERDAHAIH